MEVIVTTNVEEARRLVAEGYIPVEASYGSETVHDRTKPLLTLDHHGQFSDLECPTVRAQKEFFGQGAAPGGSRYMGSRYVLSHVDADSFLTVMGLEGYELPSTFVERVVLVDVYGHHKVPEDQRYHPEQVKLTILNDMLNHLKGFGLSEFKKAIQILQLPDDSPTIETRIEKLKARRERILANCVMFDSIVFLPMEDYGMDVAYEIGDFVVAYDTKDRYITIGCRDMETGLCYPNFTEEGLRKFWPFLGSGWGGREVVGGSPRGELMTMQQAYDTMLKLVVWLGKKQYD